MQIKNNLVEINEIKDKESILFMTLSGAQELRTLTSLQFLYLSTFLDSGTSGQALTELSKRDKELLNFETIKK